MISEVDKDTRRNEFCRISTERFKDTVFTFFLAAGSEVFKSMFFGEREQVRDRGERSFTGPLSQHAVHQFLMFIWFKCYEDLIKLLNDLEVVFKIERFWKKDEWLVLWA